MNKKGAVLTAMGFECFGLVMTCIFLGKWLDEKYGWGGLGAGIGAFVGFVGWITHLLVILKDLAKKNESSHTDPQ